MKILVYGKTGQIAQCLALHGELLGHEVVNFGRDLAQIDDLTAISKFLETNKPDVLINAAAYNNVDGAEDDFAEAMRINANGPKTLAMAAKEANIPFIHYSTDYVFDGKKHGEYFETDATNPINQYGISKLRGEEWVLANNPNAIIIRVSWVFSEFSNNFVKAMLRIAKSGKAQLSIVNDQFGIPNSAHDIAIATIKIAKSMNATNAGIYQFSSKPIVNRFDFAKYIFDKARQYYIPSCEISPIASKDFPTKAIRPIATPMNGDKLSKTFGIEIKDWQNSLDEIFIKIANNL